MTDTKEVNPQPDLSEESSTAPQSHSSQKQAKGIAIACQGGGAHAAYTGGVTSVLLDRILSPQSLDEDPLKWVGISGTSGGGITALVAWYCALFTSPKQVNESLGCLWEYNVAKRPGEIWSNMVGVWTLDWLQFDFQLNPYIAPLHHINVLLTKAWPVAANSYFPLAALIRPDYFRIESLIKKCVNKEAFEHIAYLGCFLSVYDKINAWQAAGHRDKILGGCGLRADGSPLPSRLQYQKDFRDDLFSCLAKRENLDKVAQQNENGLLAKALRKHWKEPVETTVRKIEQHGSLDEADLETIKLCVKALRDALPVLLLGAVDVGTGEFVAFSSKRAPKNRGITLDAVRASAAIPWIFQGVKVAEPYPPHKDMHVYWDGLFSQNPPISDFYTDADSDVKPDEIWIAQVNPQRSETKDLCKRLWDRRNELNGNLSLNQEIAAMAAINARINGNISSGKDKRVQILRVAMDSNWLETKLVRSLGPSSKVDRSRKLKENLFQHGEDQAKAFLPVRDLIERFWNQPNSSPASYLEVEGLPEGGIASLHKEFGSNLRFQVADMTIEHPQQHLGGKHFPGEKLRVRVSWHCNILQARLQGIAVVALNDSNQIIGLRMTSIALSPLDLTSHRAAIRTLPTSVA
ncbi:patatin-like phospholipase family protein [Azotobacter beijerinckii]|uniref:patatin-like phospholipase family protein n=1 Tax=Azotobacter beijerinckii TaxID=170623 RepID=UPI002954EB3B|nr:hypothetical protein [Azotobacter beijerinckii]MDV7213598.1 hypothetical protein [Azotobacter beijerinckii]